MKWIEIKVFENGLKWYYIGENLINLKYGDLLDIRYDYKNQVLVSLEGHLGLVQINKSSIINDKEWREIRMNKILEQ
jgi:5-deoxy-D-glucuronate isomerase